MDHVEKGLSPDGNEKGGLRVDSVENIATTTSLIMDLIISMK